MLLVKLERKELSLGEYAVAHLEILDQALEMERQQIIDAVDGFPIEHRNLDGSDYYTQTFTEPKND